MSGIAVALVSSDKVNQSTALALCILGLFVTLGIVMYELHNTLFYEMSKTRASLLKRLLEFPRFSLPDVEKSDHKTFSSLSLFLVIQDPAAKTLAKFE